MNELKIKLLFYSIVIIFGNCLYGMEKNNNRKFRLSGTAIATLYSMGSDDESRERAIKKFIEIKKDNFPRDNYKKGIAYLKSLDLPQEWRTAICERVYGWPCIATLRGHQSGINSVAISPDGIYLASGCRS